MLGSTNAEVLENYGTLVWRLVAERINTWLQYTGDFSDMTSEDLIQQGFCDPVKIFIKDEPHKLSKINEGRLRIISSVSLVDQIIERVLHYVQNKTEIEYWDQCPSAPGMGLHDDGLLALAQNMEDLLAETGEVMCTDVSGWDWSVQEWELQDDMELRWKLAGEREDSDYAHMCRVNAMVVANSVYVDPGGSCWAQQVKGIQNSGRYCTSSSNSRMRVLLSVNSRLDQGLPPLVNGHCGIKAMGDDSVEVSLPRIVESMVKFGHTISENTTATTLEGLEFCSHRWLASRYACPVAPSKTTFRFFSRPEGEEDLLGLWGQLSWYLRHLDSPEMRTTQALAQARIDRAIKL